MVSVWPSCTPSSLPFLPSSAFLPPLSSALPSLSSLSCLHLSGLFSPFWYLSLPQFLYFPPSTCCTLLPVFLSLSSKPRLCQGSMTSPTQNPRAGRGLWEASADSVENVCMDWSHSYTWGALCSDLLLAKPVPEESALRPGTARDQVQPEVRIAVWEN